MVTKIHEEKAVDLKVIGKKYFLSVGINDKENVVSFNVIKDKEIVKRFTLPYTQENLEKFEKDIKSITTEKEMWNYLSKSMIRK